MYKLLYEIKSSILHVNIFSKYFFVMIISISIDLHLYKYKSILNKTLSTTSVWYHKDISNYCPTPLICIEQYYRVALIVWIDGHYVDFAKSALAFPRALVYFVLFCIYVFFCILCILNMYFILYGDPDVTLIKKSNKKSIKTGIYLILL